MSTIILRSKQCFSVHCCWNIVANEGLLYSFHCYMRNRMHSPNIKFIYKVYQFYVASLFFSNSNFRGAIAQLVYRDSIPDYGKRLPVSARCECYSTCPPLSGGETRSWPKMSIWQKEIPWPESTSELYQPSDRRLSAKLMPTFADRGCHVVSVTDLYGHILGSLDRNVHLVLRIIWHWIEPPRPLYFRARWLTDHKDSFLLCGLLNIKTAARQQPKPLL
jgi:hypothetical protein